MTNAEAARARAVAHRATLAADVLATADALVAEVEAVLATLYEGRTVWFARL